MYSHPKVEKLQDIVVCHFLSFQEKNVATRVMIFCEVGSQFLQCICRMLYDLCSAHISHCEVMGLLAPLYGVEKLPLYTCTEKKSLPPLFSFLPYLPKLKLRIFPNYLKNGGGSEWLEAHGFGCLVFTHKVMPHKTLFFLSSEICPHGPQKSPHIVTPDDKLLSKQAVKSTEVPL